MQFPTVSLPLGPTFPQTHVQNMEDGKQTRKFIWSSSRASSPLPSFPLKRANLRWRYFLSDFYHRNLETRPELVLLRESPVQITTQQYPHTYQRQWIRSIPALISHHYIVLMLLSCGQQCSGVHLC